jgi:hypothetical protein
MEDIRQCWAFHRDGARCEHPAGHPGDHAVQKTWNDLQCATPGEFGEPERSAPGTPVTVPVGVPEFLSNSPEGTVAPELVSVPITKCVACGHKHRGGECRCGCYEFIG